MASIDMPAALSTGADAGQEIGKTPGGSLIPKRKPIAVVARLIAAEKIKRRSVQALRGRAIPNGGAQRLENVQPRGSISARNQAPASTSQPPRPVFRNSTNGGPSTNGRSQPRAPSINQANAGRPQLGPRNRPPPVTGRGNAKAAAEAAIQQKAKPARFVSRHEQQLQRQLTQFQERVAQRDTELEGLKRANVDLEAAYDQLQTKASQDGHDLIHLRTVHAAALADLNMVRDNLRSADELAARRGDQLANVTRHRDELQAELEAKIATNNQLTAKIFDLERDRRYLHNLVVELKGNIRVFCRVRPVLSEEFGVVTTLENVKFPIDDDKKLEIRQPIKANLSTPMLKNGAASSATVTSHTFEFDKVFGPESTQKDVFEEISLLVQSAIDGYNVCIFAYGQTGSGKTYTMEGAPVSMASTFLEPYGMIELSASRIFDHITVAIQQGWHFTVEASFVEIYNELVYDLLTKDPKIANNKTYEIKLVPGSTANELDVPGVTTVVANSIQDLKPLLATAQRNRAWAATKCNDHSSRSHSIFRMRLVGSHVARGLTTSSLISLVDLAGSENVKKSESVGQQLREAQNINTSLMQLGKVISALTSGASHIPYRDSKLTYMLQNSLGGNSKTLMFVNISPENDCITESVNSLRFASQVNQCHIGSAKKNVAASRPAAK